MENKCDKCESVNLHFVKYEMSNKVKILRKQCYDCGRLLTHTYKKNTIRDFDSLPDADLNKKESYTNIKLRFSELRTESFEMQKKYYREVYLKSEIWKEKRDLIVKFYSGLCFKCGESAKDVHHKTYENIYTEKFEDLIPLCRDCHEKEHEKPLKPIYSADLKKENVVLTNQERISALSLKSIQMKRDLLNKKQ